MKNTPNDTPPHRLCLSEITWIAKTDQFHPQEHTASLNCGSMRMKSICFPGQRSSPRHFAFQGMNGNIWTRPDTQAIRRVSLQLQSIGCLLIRGCQWDSIELTAEVNRASHLLRQHHGLGLLSLQSGPAHAGLQLAEADVGPVHLTEVLRLQGKPSGQSRKIQASSAEESLNTLQPSLWRCWVYFQWFQPIAAGCWKKTAWQWSSREPDEGKTCCIKKAEILRIVEKRDSCQTWEMCFTRKTNSGSAGYFKIN